MNMKQVSKPARRGVASIVLVIVLVVAGFAVVGMVLGGARDQDLSVARVNSLQAFYAAEAGVNLAFCELIDDTDHDGNGEVGSVADSSAMQAALHGASVAVSKSVAGSDITLTSLGIDQNARHSFSTILELTSSGGSLGTPHGIAVNGDITIKGSGRVDAFDSSSGVYVPGNDHTGFASIATNTTGNNKVEIKDSGRINGDLYVGMGGNPSSVIEIKGSGVVAGTQDSLDEAMTLPSVTTPSGLPSNSGNVEYKDSGSTTISAGTYHYDDFDAKGSHVITITGDVTLYCEKKFEIKDSAQLKLATGATLTVYAKEFDIKGSSKLNIPDSPTRADPSRVTLLSHSDKKFEVKDSAIVVAVVVAPQSDISLKGSGRLFGTVQGDKIEIKDSGKFTQDLALAGSSSGGGGSGGTSSVVLSTWSQVSPQ